MMDDAEFKKMIKSKDESEKRSLNRGDKVDVKEYDGKTRLYEYSYSATFLEIGVDFEDFDNGVGNFSTAIVIKDDGKVRNPPIELINKVLT